MHASGLWHPLLFGSSVMFTTSGSFFSLSVYLDIEVLDCVGL